MLVLRKLRHWPPMPILEPMIWTGFAVACLGALLMPMLARQQAGAGSPKDTYHEEHSRTRKDS